MIRKPHRFLKIWLFILCVVNLIYLGKARSQQISKASFSLRAGLPVNDNDNGFRQYDFFFDLRLPVIAQLANGWIFNIRLDGVAGLLTESGKKAFLVSAGPGFLLTKAGWRLALKLGSSPTFLSDPKFPKKDLGGSFHFISHIGVTLRVARNWGLVYRIQHLSNASIVQPNPGLNLHIVGLYARID